MKIIAIIQARMGATRLPGKMLMDIGGKPAVAWSVERTRLARTVAEVWLATTVSPGDDALFDWAKGQGMLVYRGSEQDVLDRYYQTAKHAGADVVVRITADCPLIDPDVIDAVVSAFTAGDFGFVSNVHPPTFPDGLDVEVFSFATLERAWREAILPSEREHVTPYMWKRPELFRMLNIEYRISNDTVDLSSHRWTLDTPEDLELIRRIVGELPKYQEPTKLETVLAILAEHPDWLAVNAKYQRNEGYQKSVRAD